MTAGSSGGDDMDRRSAEAREGGIWEKRVLDPTSIMESERRCTVAPDEGEMLPRSVVGDV